jgi:5-hydroxyisourate hydrolase-like protein (transthyretin family)
MNYFLEIFVDFFHFLNSNSNLKNRSGCYHSVLLLSPGGNNGYRGNRSGYQQ